MSFFGRNVSNTLVAGECNSVTLVSCMWADGLCAPTSRHLSMGMWSAATSFKKAMNSPLSFSSPKFLTTSGINDWIISMSSLLFSNRIFRFRRQNFALFHAFFISNLGVLLLVIGVEWPFGDSFVISPVLTLWNFIHLSSFHPMEWQWRFPEMPIIDYAIGTCFDHSINHHCKHQSH